METDTLNKDLSYQRCKDSGNFLSTFLPGLLIWTCECAGTARTARKRGWE